jgi:hypothetical protein
MVVVKTGASITHKRLPILLMTRLKCLPPRLSYHSPTWTRRSADTHETISGYTIRDALDDVLESTKTDNGDFELYNLQTECAVNQHSCRSLLKDKDFKAGWNLDKYKNVHIAEKVHRLRPGYDCVGSTAWGEQWA